MSSQPPPSRISEVGFFKMRDMGPPSQDMPRWCEWHQSEPSKPILRRYCDAPYDRVEMFILTNPEQEFEDSGKATSGSFAPSLLEIVQRDKPTKAYLDLDWEFEKIPNLTDSRVSQLVEMIQNAGHSLLRDALGASGIEAAILDQLQIHPVLLGSKRPRKWSVHVIWNIMHRETGAQWALPNGAAAKQFAIDLRSELVRRHGVDYRELIDIQPYPQNEGSTYPFRVIGASKGVEPRSRLDLWDDGMLVPVRCMPPEDRLAYWRASLVQHFVGKLNIVKYEECRGTGARAGKGSIGTRTVSQTGSIRGVGDVRLTTSLLRAPHEMEAAACLEEYIRYYAETVEAPLARSMEPHCHRSTRAYKIEINVWKGWCNWASESGLCHTKIQRCSAGESKLHRHNNVWYSLLFHRPQLKQRCRNTQCEDWRADRNLWLVTIKDVPDERGLLKRAQRLMAPENVTQLAVDGPPCSPMPDTPQTGTRAASSAELVCDYLTPGPRGHFAACESADRGDPWPGQAQLLKELQAKAPPAAQYACVMSHNHIPTPKGSVKGVRFRCVSMLLWADLRKPAWITGRQKANLTSPERVWFLVWNTAARPTLQTGVKLEPGMVCLLPAPCIQERVPCSVNTPEWFSSIPPTSSRQAVTVGSSSATFYDAQAFPYANGNTAHIYRCAVHMLPVLRREKPTRTMDTLHISALLISVMNAPRTCSAVQDMISSSSAPITQLDERARERIETHLRDRDSRCLKLGRRWATNVWVDGPGSTSMHLKAMFSMLYGLLSDFASSAP